MILDLHVHTVLSGDAKPTVEEYAERALEIRKRRRLDGFVITEHRLWSEERNAEFADLSAKTGLVILQGVELETDFGHILIYGVNPTFTEMVDVGARAEGLKAVKAANKTGAFAVPAHPARQMLGCGVALRALKGIRAIECFNGDNSESENAQSEVWMKELGLWGTGGSDAHFLKELGKCATEFDARFDNEEGFIRALQSGKYKATLARQKTKGIK